MVAMMISPPRYNFFPEFTRAQPAGAARGAVFLGQEGIGVGFRLEIGARGLLVATTPVRSIARGGDGRVH